MMRHLPTILFLISLFCVPWQAGAAPAARSLGAAGDVGFGALGDRATATIQTGLDIQEGSLSLGIFGKVRLLMSGDEDDVIHRRDYDEPSDYVHLLRHLDFQRRLAPVDLELRVGELLGHTLGHGSLIRDFSNIGDPDHPHSGLRFRVAHERFSVEGLLDNFIKPAVAALRLEGKPAARLPGLTVGGSAVLDPTAPLVVRADEQGTREVDDAWNLQAEEQVLALLGVDISYLFEGLRGASLEPYVDVNTSLLGMGVHAGLLGRLPLGRADQVLGVQAEYHFSTDGYSPTHMDTFYDVERLQACLTFSDPRTADLHERGTKLAGLMRGVYGGHGGLAQVGLGLRTWVTARLGYAMRPGPDAHSLWLRVSSRPFARLDLGALMMLRGLETGHEVSSGLVAMAEARFRITDNLYALGQYTRLWSLSEDTRYFETLQSFNLSVGANWSQ